MGTTAMIDKPTDWSVKNGAFIGYVLVQLKAETGRMGLPQNSGEGWLPCARDLRSIDSIKVPDSDNHDRCALYHGDTFVGEVNAPFAELLPAWLSVRHAFDRMECFDPAPQNPKIEFIQPS